ncbi:hypothetical protein C8Q78DRAFT_1029290 [Trametes maxima]|nr:hypothetical protein C8Q78DRAFT_1029290 [Trametes maxima]
MGKHMGAPNTREGGIWIEDSVHTGSWMRVVRNAIFSNVRVPPLQMRDGSQRVPRKRINVTGWSKPQVSADARTCCRNDRQVVFRPRLRQ